MHAVLAFLRARADNVAVGLLTAMFLSFILQIFSRYVINHPLGWTLEACLITWLWVVFWGSAFLVGDNDQVKFDVVYWLAGPRLRRVFALVSAAAIAAAFGLSFPRTLDYILFMRIEKSSTLGIRLDFVFMVYAVFAAAITARYLVRVIVIAIGKDPDGTLSEKAPHIHTPTGEHGAGPS